jgi:hypothetical protein
MTRNVKKMMEGLAYQDAREDFQASTPLKQTFQAIGSSLM